MQNFYGCKLYIKCLKVSLKKLTKPYFLKKNLWKKFFWKISLGQQGLISSKNEVFGVVTKILSFHMFLFFFFGYGLLNFNKNQMFEKNVVIELWSKNL